MVTVAAAMAIKRCMDVYEVAFRYKREDQWEQPAAINGNAFGLKHVHTTLSAVQIHDGRERERKQAHTHTPIKIMR